MTRLGVRVYHGDTHDFFCYHKFFILSILLILVKYLLTWIDRIHRIMHQSGVLRHPARFFVKIGVLLLTSLLSCVYKK